MVLSSSGIIRSSPNWTAVVKNYAHRVVAGGHGNVNSAQAPVSICGEARPWPGGEAPCVCGAAGRLFRHDVAHARVARVAVQQQQPRQVAELADRKVGREDRLQPEEVVRTPAGVACVCVCVRVRAVAGVCLGVRHCVGMH